MNHYFCLGWKHSNSSPTRCSKLLGVSHSTSPWGQLLAKVDLRERETNFHQNRQTYREITKKHRKSLWWIRDEVVFCQKDIRKDRCDTLFLFSSKSWKEPGKIVIYWYYLFWRYFRMGLRVGVETYWNPTWRLCVFFKQYPYEVVLLQQNIPWTSRDILDS